MLSIFNKGAVCAFLAMALFFSWVDPAFSFSKQDVLQPLQDDLEQVNSALAEVKRQAALYVQEQKDFGKFLEDRQVDLEKAQIRLLQEQEARKLSLNRSVLAGWQLVNELDDIIHIPLQGMITMDELLARRDSQFKALEEEAALIQSGDEPIHIQGLGLITKNELDKRIKKNQELIAAFEKQVEDGNYTIYFPGLGEVDRLALEKHKQHIETNIITTTAQINSGDYIVVIPHVGPVSKNSLQQKIDSVTATIAALTESFKAGEERILRTSFGWSTANDVQTTLATLQKQDKTLKQELKDKSYAAMLPTGWTTAKEISKQIEQLKKETSGIEQKLAEGEYEVALPDGTWANADELDKALINALLPAAVRLALEKGRKNIAVTAAIDIRLRQIEAEKLSAWLQDFNSLATPEKAQLDLKQKLQKELLGEFRKEQDMALRWLNKHKQWLEKQKRYLP